jgi:hypothetical protein
MANGKENPKTSAEGIVSFKDWTRQHLSMPRHTIPKDVDKDKGKESPEEHALEVRQGKESSKFAFKAQVIRKIQDDD